MSSNRTGGPSQPDNDIVDAEFVEVDDWQPLPPRSPEPLKRGTHGCLKATVLGVAAIPLLLVIAVIVGPPPGPATTDDNVILNIDETTIMERSRGSSVQTPDGEAPMTAPSRKMPAIPRMRKGELYSAVRNRLLAAGFSPAQYDQRDCSPYGTEQGEPCFDRPEVSYCSGTGMGFCSAYWLRGGEALSITVAEGPDGTFDGLEKITRADVVAVLAQDGKRLVD